MIPLRVSVRNFLSFGDEPAVFEFADGDPLWVIRGPNGVGKSAVFDAITYALYGHHRGGKNDARELVRHKANAFEVEFDFEFAGAVYRIRRTRTDRETGRPTTQQVARRDGDEFVTFRAGDTAGADTAKDIENWVAATLGLKYEAFTKSVLLRQGKADELFQATGPERRQVLKEIMGFERFEALYKRVHEAARECDRKAKTEAVRLAGLSPATADERAAAREAAEMAGIDAAAARDALTAAAERVGRAATWEGLKRRQDDLDSRLAAADGRAARGGQIRQEARTLIELSAAVPALQDWLAARDRLAESEAAAAKAAEMRATDAARRDAAAEACRFAREKADGHRRRAADLATRAADLGRQVEADAAQLTRAEAVAAVDADLMRFPADLDDRLAAAVAGVEAAGPDDRAAAAAEARARAGLAEVRKQQERFAAVENDPVCSYCGQAVDEAHAAKERGRLDREEAGARAELDRAADAAADAVARLDAARAERARLEKQATARDKMAHRRDGLTAAGPVEPAEVLRARLAAAGRERDEAGSEQRAEAAAATAAEAEADRHEQHRAEAEAAVARADAAARAADTGAAVARSGQAAAVARVPADWLARLPEVDAGRVAGLAADRDRLAAAGVAEALAELDQDAVRRAEWAADRAGVSAGIGAIPEADRVPAADAQAAQRAAQEKAEFAAGWKAAADQLVAELAGRQTAYDAATAEARAAAEAHRLHHRLDALLGGDGLQLDLVRDAEGQIVAHANETLGHLSDGDLALEEDAAAAAAKAFDLRVRLGGGDPIGVNFLSGSQRFRVAVAVALAVGRFASGRARPLEAVVIDEGFGSLDRDGLRAMADELKRLQQAAALKRVILVSHQEEFTDQFPVGYELTPGDDGTTARPFRRG